MTTSNWSKIEASVLLKEKPPQTRNMWPHRNMWPPNMCAASHKGPFPDQYCLAYTLTIFQTTRNVEDITIEMYADDTRMYCMSNSVDSTIASLDDTLGLCAK